MTRQFLFATITLLSLMTSCRFTRTDVIGKWKEQFDDTLIINQDNSFIFIRDKFSKANSTDSSQMHLVGQWTLKKKTIYLIFSDTMQDFGGGCKNCQYWWTKGSKKKLIRPSTYKSPTHHFWTITKIN